MWLNQKELDIRCVRIKPYSHDGRVLVDVQQIIPMPEAVEYVVGIKNKQQRDRVARESSRDSTKFDVVVGSVSYPALSKRIAIFRIVKFLFDSSISPELLSKVSGWGGRRFRFANSLVNSRSSFIAAMRAEELAGGKPFDSLRYFCDDGELLQSNGKTWVLSNQWGTETYGCIEELKKTFADKDFSCTPST